MPVELSAIDARRLAVAAQGLTGRRHSSPRRLLDDLGAIQLDTISVLARSHELVCHARLGSTTRDQVNAAFWGRRRDVFEYWAHAACLLPMDLWPSMALRRRRNRLRFGDADDGQKAARAEVLAELTSRGPLLIGELGGARDKPGWWEWSPLKRAAELLLAMGDVVTVERRGWRRVYDLPERAIPADLLAQDPDDVTCATDLIGIASRRMGVATTPDLADYFRLTIAHARTGITAAGLEPARVEGWDKPAWLAAGALRTKLPTAHRPVLLSPFDSLIWFRERAERAFEFRHRIEAYTPAAKRQQGYFAMPLLADFGLRGWADPKRDGSTLIIRNHQVEAAAVPAMAEAVADAAAWKGCDAVVVEGGERITRDGIMRALAAAGLAPNTP